MDTTPSTNEVISRLLDALEVFREADKDISVGEAIAFLHVALGETNDGGLSVTELSKAQDLPMATASRHVLALGDRDRHHQPGKEWISAAVDMMERRKKILRLTARGRRIVTSISTALEGRTGLRLLPP